MHCGCLLSVGVFSDNPVPSVKVLPRWKLNVDHLSCRFLLRSVCISPDNVHRRELLPCGIIGGNTVSSIKFLPCCKLRRHDMPRGFQVRPGGIGADRLHPLVLLPAGVLGAIPVPGGERLCQHLVAGCVPERVLLSGWHDGKDGLCCGQRVRHAECADSVLFLLLLSRGDDGPRAVSPWERVRLTVFAGCVLEWVLLQRRDDGPGGLSCWQHVRRRCIRSDCVHPRKLVSGWQLGAGCVCLGQLLCQSRCEGDLLGWNLLSGWDDSAGALRPWVFLQQPVVAGGVCWGLLLRGGPDGADPVSRGESVRCWRHRSDRVPDGCILPSGELRRAVVRRGVCV